MDIYRIMSKKATEAVSSLPEEELSAWLFTFLAGGWQEKNYVFTLCLMYEGLKNEPVVT